MNRTSGLSLSDIFAIAFVLFILTTLNVLKSSYVAATITLMVLAKSLQLANRNRYCNYIIGFKIGY